MRMDMTLAIVTCVVLLVVAIAVVTVILVRRHRRSREIFLKFDTMAGPCRVFTVERKGGARAHDERGGHHAIRHISGR